MGSDSHSSSYAGTVDMRRIGKKSYFIYFPGFSFVIPLMNIYTVYPSGKGVDLCVSVE